MVQIVKQQLLFSDIRAAQSVILLLTFKSRHGKGQLAYISVPFKVYKLGLTNFACSTSQIEVFSERLHGTFYPTRGSSFFGASSCLSDYDFCCMHTGSSSSCMSIFGLWCVCYDVFHPTISQFITFVYQLGIVVIELKLPLMVGVLID